MLWIPTADHRGRKDSLCHRRDPPRTPKRKRPPALPEFLEELVGASEPTGARTTLAALEMKQAEFF